MRDVSLDLSRGLRALGQPADAATLQRFTQYLDLLARWGRVHNLTSIRDVPAMVPAHVMDSLCAAPYVLGDTVLDVGSGAGLPGIPLAVVRPDVLVTLIECRRKKAEFLRHVVGALGMQNVQVICDRVEQYEPTRKFDTLVTRAFSTVAGFATLAGRLCAPGGRLIALKGRYPGAELSEVDSEKFDITAVHAVSVPGLEARRHIVTLRPRT